MQHDLKLTDAELMVINDCLMLGPFGKVAPVVQSINSQLQQSRSQDDVSRNSSDKPAAA